MDVRKLFEAKFPVPGCLHFGEAGNYELKRQCFDHVLCVEYNAKFEGFRAAHELLAKDAERWRTFRELSITEKGNVAFTTIPAFADQYIDARITAALAAQEPK